MYAMDGAVQRLGVSVMHCACHKKAVKGLVVLAGYVYLATRASKPSHRYY